jgi:hypothetical protein
MDQMFAIINNNAITIFNKRSSLTLTSKNAEPNVAHW